MAPFKPSLGCQKFHLTSLCLYYEDIHSRIRGDTLISPLCSTKKESINYPLRTPSNISPLENSSVTCRIIMVPETCTNCTQHRYHISNLNTFTTKSNITSLLDETFAAIDSYTVLLAKRNISRP